MNLSTRQLKAFLALAQHRNFTRAAEQSHLSQPAFSSLIRSLEKDAGVRLFDRDTRKVVLTAAGRRFEASAQRLLTEMNAAICELREGSVVGGSVAIAAMPSLSARALPPVIARLHQDEPGLSLALIDALPEQCLAMVRSAQVDFALTTIGRLSAEFATEPFCTDEFHLVCRSDHPLAQRESVDVGELVDYPFVHFSQATRLRQQIDASVHPRQMNAVLEIERLESVRGMVESGAGISLVPGLTLFHFDSASIVTRPLRPPGITREICCVRLANRPLSPSAARVWAAIRAAPPKHS
jgi:LysR family carnitine catabolism transcriptional activator